MSKFLQLGYVSCALISSKEKMIINKEAQLKQSNWLYKCLDQRTGRTISACRRPAPVPLANLVPNSYRLFRSIFRLNLLSTYMRGWGWGSGVQENYKKITKFKCSQTNSKALGHYYVKMKVRKLLYWHLMLEVSENRALMWFWKCNCV